MSEVKVNKISPRSGTTVTIGDSGDTINLVGTLQNNGSPLAGDISSVVAGTGLSGGATSGVATLNIEAAQPTITSLGTITSFTSTGIDDNATSTAITIDSSERVLINQTSSISGGGIIGSLQLSGTNFNNSSVSFSNFGNDANPSILAFNKSRSGVIGTTGTIVQNGDNIGNINWNADDGTNLGSNLARISGQIDGVPGVNDTPGRLVFYTTADGSASVTERMRIDSSGNVGIGTSSPASELHVKSSDNRAQISIENDVEQGAIRMEGINPVDGNDNLQITASTSASDRAIYFTTSDSSPNGKMILDSSGNVGVGITTPTSKLEIYDTGTFNARTSGINIHRPGSYGQYASISFNSATTYFSSTYNGAGAGSYGDFRWQAYDSTSTPVERMRIDSSGNVLVGKTSSSSSTAGVEFRPAGLGIFGRDGNTPVLINRNTNDGTLVDFRRSGTAFGKIGSDNSLLTIGSGDTGIKFSSGVDSIFPFDVDTNANRDNAVDFGYSTVRWKDLYLGGGLYVGGTGTANKLDDYEEGTWTPSVASGSISGTSISYTGKYIKVGDILVIYFEATTASSDIQVSSYVQFSGIPFTILTRGSSTVLTEDVDQTARQGFSTVGTNERLFLGACGSSSGTTRIHTSVVCSTA